MAVPLGDDALLGGDGRPVVSSLRSEALREAAERTGGFYIDGNRSNTAAQLAEYLSSLASGGTFASGRDGAPQGAAKGFRREKRPLPHVFIIAALILMGISKIAEKGRRKNG